MNINELRQLAGLPEIAGTVSEDVSDTGDEVVKTVAGHTDDERDMIRKELFQMGSYCVELYKMLGDLPDNVDFPHWWQAKITKASEYVSTTKHYLENELNVPDLDQPADMGDDIDPSGVS